MVQGIPEGYELVRIGNPDNGELWLGNGSIITKQYGYWDYEHPVAILRKIENNWKRLTLGMWDGVPRLARFRLTRHEPWVYGECGDHRPFAGFYNKTDGMWYKHAEVRDTV